MENGSLLWLIYRREGEIKWRKLVGEGEKVWHGSSRMFERELFSRVVRENMAGFAGVFVDLQKLSGW